MKTSFVSPIIAPWAIVLAAALFVGCQGYRQQADSTEALPHRVFKPPVENGAVADTQSTTYQGTIHEVGPMNLALSADDGIDRTFAVTSDTIIKLNDQPASLQDLATGQSAKVRALVKEDVLIAQQINAKSLAQQDATSSKSSDARATAPTKTEGTIKQINTDRLVILGRDQTEAEFDIANTTQFTLDGQEASVNNLAEGQHVVVLAEIMNDRWTARRVDATTEGKDFNGDAADSVHSVRTF